MLDSINYNLPETTWDGQGFALCPLPTFRPAVSLSLMQEAVMAQGACDDPDCIDTGFCICGICHETELVSAGYEARSGRYVLAPRYVAERLWWGEAD